jgi:hypothetical protein
LAVGLGALAVCAWALVYFGGNDASGRQRTKTPLGTYVLIYAVIFGGGAGLILLGFGVGLDDLSNDVVSKISRDG